MRYKYNNMNVEKIQLFVKGNSAYLLCFCDVESHFFTRRRLPVFHSVHERCLSDNWIAFFGQMATGLYEGVTYIAVSTNLVQEINQCFKRSEFCSFNESIIIPVSY